MATTQTTRDGETIADMNTTPLIDVMLVLLTLLIITLPLQTNAVKIDLPRHTAPPLHPPPAVTLAVDFDGTVTWNGVPIDRATLDADLAAAAAQDQQPDIRIQANRFAHYDTVAMILADAQHIGARHIGFVGTEGY